MEGAAATATGIPPLSLSSGPAISGGDFYGGTPTTGDFRYYGRQTAFETVSQNLPLLVVAGVAAWLIFRK